jgi:hypothetical protein
MIKLSKVIANDLNQIAATLIEENQQHSDGFNLDWFKRNRRPDLQDSYLDYLVFLINHYNQKHNAEFINMEDGVNLNRTATTPYFLQQGGYVKIFNEEHKAERRKNVIYIITITTILVSVLGVLLSKC